MPRLEIQHRNGSAESVDLSTGNPLLIGSNLSSDIYLDAPGVAAAHCRVQWTGDELEVQAATPAGVVINGKTVSQGTLQHGGMLRIGDINLVLMVTEPEEPEEVAPSESIILKPTSEEAQQKNNLFVPPVKARVPASRPPEARPRKASPDADEPAEDTFDELYQDPVGDSPSQHEWLDEALEEGEALEELPDELEELPDDAEMIDGDSPPVMLQRGGGGTARKGTAVAAGPSLGSQLKSTFRAPSGRRSQRDPLRSPMVMILGGTLAVLALLAATIFFIVSRQQVDAEFKVAMAQHEAGNFAQAIEALEKFAQAHPSHASADEARVTAAKDKVNQHLGGTVPEWAKALSQLNDYVKEFSNKASFKDADSPLRQFVAETSKQVALGSLKTAETLKRRALLDTSDEARRLFEAFEPEKELSRQNQVNDMLAKRKVAEEAILQNETLEEGIKRYDTAFNAGKTLDALDVYRRLLFRYTDFVNHRELQSRLRKALEKEKEVVQRTTPNKEAVTEDRPLPTVVPPLSLARNARTRNDKASVGSTVFAVAADCVFGVDSVTGNPVWRRAIGIGTPFFPVRVTTGTASLLLFDTRYNELVVVEERTGKLQWRQQLDEPVLGAPLVIEGQIFVSGKGGSLSQVDLNTGKLSTVLKFSQAIVGAPVLSDSGERMYVAGHDALLYALTRRPLACDRAVWIGHGPGAITAPLLMMKSYLLMADNDRVDSCRLRLLDTSRDGQTPAEIASQRVLGHVHSTMVLRGKQLFVPSVPERITAFTVSEVPDAKALIQIASYARKESRDGPLFLSAGPDDQLWAAGAELQKFQLQRESLGPDGQAQAVGIAAQPLQMSGDSLFIARHPFQSKGVLLSEYQRVSMQGQWQVALGGQILEAAAPTPQSTSFVCVTSLGDAYQVTQERLAKGGFEITAAVNLAQSDLARPEDAETPFFATRFGDGQLVVRGGKPPRLWFLAGDGTVSRELKTADVLQADPIQLAAGIVLPLPGRLTLINKTTGIKVVEDLIIKLAQGGAPFRWVSLVPLDETQFIALTDDGQVLRVQFRTGSPSSLGIVTQKSLEQAVKTPFVLGGGRIVLTTNAPKLVLWDVNDLGLLGEQALPAPAAQAPWILGDRVYVDIGGQKLVCYDAAASLKQMWELPLGGTSIGGTPLIYGDALLVVLQDGRIWKIDTTNGKILEEGSFDVHERVTFGPRAIGNSLIIGTLNGSLYTLSSVMQKGK